MSKAEAILADPVFLDSLSPAEKPPSRTASSATALSALGYINRLKRIRPRESSANVPFLKTLLGLLAETKWFPYSLELFLMPADVQRMRGLNGDAGDYAFRMLQDARAHRVARLVRHENKPPRRSRLQENLGKDPWKKRQYSMLATVGIRRREIVDL